MTSLAKQFFDHSIERTYQALVWGVPKLAEGTINVNVGRSLKDRRITTAFPEGDFGRTAITHYKVLQDYRYVSLIECKLETGRTHQIRAHMKFIGHPIFNDATYGGNDPLKGTVFSKYKQFVDNCFKIIPRQALHAKTLGFIHPGTNKLNFFEGRISYQVWRTPLHLREGTKIKRLRLNFFCLAPGAMPAGFPSWLLSSKPCGQPIFQAG